jgi:hypothetical protein
VVYHLNHNRNFKHIITKSILEQLEITEKASAVRFNKKKEVLYLLSTFIAVLHYKRIDIYCFLQSVNIFHLSRGSNSSFVITVHIYWNHMKIQLESFQLKHSALGNNRNIENLMRYTAPNENTKMEAFMLNLALELTKLRSCVKKIIVLK